MTEPSAGIVHKKKNSKGRDMRNFLEVNIFPPFVSDVQFKNSGKFEEAM